MAHGNTHEVVAYDANSSCPIIVLFDTLTPRPHFILVQRDRQRAATPSELQAGLELVQQFLTVHTEYDHDAILSFHRGTWYQQHTNCFHAHLCVPRQPYTLAAAQRVTFRLNNKEWCGASTYTDAMTARDQRQISKNNQYKQDCLRMARDPGFVSRVDHIPLSSCGQHSTEFRAVWSSPQPRIGIVATSANSTLSSLHTFMVKFHDEAVKQLTKLDRGYANFGCHFCLYVRGSTQGKCSTRPSRILHENETTVATNESLVGYIHMDPTDYMKWLPSKIRSVWIAEFQQADFNVLT